VLTSLLLHCCSRTGLLSYLYEQRHEIAYALGIIDEVPIAFCGAAYYNDQGIVVQTETQHESIPPVLRNATEIILFFSFPETPIQVRQPLLSDGPSSVYHVSSYEAPAQGLFQPPRI